MIQHLSTRPQETDIGVQSDTQCPSCQHQGLIIFYEARHVPVHSCLMVSTREEALNFPCSDVRLGFCPECGFITNVDFDAQWSAYASNYEDQQSFSPTFNQFAFDLANRLIQKYDLRHKDIVEIGCSKGDFLLLLCELGNNRGVGIDPSVIPGRVESSAADRVRFIPEYFSDRHAQYMGDFVCCRHTLEHIHATAEFLQTVRRCIGDRSTTVFFEIPDTMRVLNDLAFEDIYYEHCSYFTPGSLARLFRACGFTVMNLETVYDNQYLLIEAKVTNQVESDGFHPLEENVHETYQAVQNFSQKFSTQIAQWNHYIDTIRAKGKRIVIWGSGSKCVAFLSAIRNSDVIDCIVDINPHRQGKFIPGIGKPIMSPHDLTRYQPDHVIIMNPIYAQEIQQTLAQLDLTPEVVTL